MFFAFDAFLLPLSLYMNPLSFSRFLPPHFLAVFLDERRYHPHFPNKRLASSSEDVYTQMQKLSKQATAVTALLEAQHSAAQMTIQTLESKVETLEGMLKVAEEALMAKTLQEEEAKEMEKQEVQFKENEEKNEKESLTEMLAQGNPSPPG
jgi:hypothetical protein